MMPIKEFSRKKRYVNSFNDNGFLNVIMPLTPRHFSDVTKLDLYSARVRCENCTCGFVQAQGGYALCNSAREQLAARQEGWDRWITAFYFGSWYLLSIGHSVFNKKVTNVLPLPWCVATAQIVVGALLVRPVNGLRERLKMSRAALRTMLPIGALHAIGHVSGVVGTTWGSVSFAQVVKSAGPVYACLSVWCHRPCRPRGLAAADPERRAPRHHERARSRRRSAAPSSPTWRLRSATSTRSCR